MITSGSLNGVIAGSRYNFSWYVHEVLSEPLERILLTQFLAEKKQELPTKLQEVASDPLSHSEVVGHNSEEFFVSYEDYVQFTLNGINGNSAILGYKPRNDAHAGNDTYSCSREQLRDANASMVLLDSILFFNNFV